MAVHELRPSSAVSTNNSSHPSLYKLEKENNRKHTYIFMHFAAQTLLLNFAFIPILLNLVTYLHGTMHEDIANSSTMVNNLVGASCAFSLLGAFISDSYITRFKTILIFGPIEFMVIIHLNSSFLMIYITSNVFILIRVVCSCTCI